MLSLAEKREKKKDIHRVTTTDKVLMRYVVVGKSHARSHIPFIEIGRHCSHTFFFSLMHYMLVSLFFFNNFFALSILFF